MYKKITPILCLILILLISFNAPVYSSDRQSTESYQNLSEIINALDITRTKYQEKIYTQKTVKIRNEYTIFIEYLSFQINNYCDQIIRGSGIEAIKDLQACDTNKIYFNIEEIYQTSEDKIALLDDQLLETMGEFDEMLLTEDEIISQTIQNKASRNSSDSKQNSSSEGLSKSHKNNQSQTSQISKENSNQYTNNNSSRKNSSVSQGNQRQFYNTNKQRKIISEIDDDIVARQLKEAAGKEMNPDLKEKLWDEYYKYKQSVGQN